MIYVVTVDGRTMCDTVMQKAGLGNRTSAQLTQTNTVTTPNQYGMDLICNKRSGINNTTPKIGQFNQSHKRHVSLTLQNRSPMSHDNQLSSELIEHTAPEATLTATSAAFPITAYHVQLGLLHG